MEGKLPEQELERAYDLIATAIDRVGKERESEFLAKLCLGLAAQLESSQQVENVIRACEGPDQR